MKKSEAVVDKRLRTRRKIIIDNGRFFNIWDLLIFYAPV